MKYAILFSAVVFSTAAFADGLDEAINTMSQLNAGQQPSVYAERALPPGAYVPPASAQIPVVPVEPVQNTGNHVTWCDSSPIGTTCYH